MSAAKQPASGLPRVGLSLEEALRYGPFWALAAANYLFMVYPPS